MDISILIPAYNEAKRLPVTLEKIFKHLANGFQGQFEVVVANDGSNDNTAAVVNALAEKYSQLRLLDYKENRGRGAVCQAAVLKVEGKYILISDADGSTDEKFITPFFEYLETHHDVSMLVGSRDIEGAQILTPQPKFRILLNKIFLVMAKMLFGWPMHDRVNGFKMIRQVVARDIYSHQTETSFFAEAELIFIADSRGWKVKELPIEWTDDRDSKVKPVREAINSFVGMFKIFIRGKRGVYKDQLKANIS
ncbi:hypothetical protein CL634_06635 [bacterium]|nr:hypothetical protein [bacterium]